ncbi:MAG TPA: HIT domain-containing protein [Candidatus Saccharimonadales bacterium]|nr:HIT domain-containing protein [Candidatus Saccharimonadales bacterium]
MADSIFTKIIKGEIPAHKIYEDDKTLAFLDINPIQPGHALVIPKTQIEFLWDLPDDDYQALMATVKLVARRIRDVLSVRFVGVKVIGEEVPHAHVHLIPFNSAENYYARRPADPEPNHSALADMAQKLAF